jgi:hypothetical protein
MTNPYAVEATPATDVRAKMAVWLPDEPVWSRATVADLVDPTRQMACRVGQEFLWQDGYGRFFNNDGVQVFPRRNDGTDA